MIDIDISVLVQIISVLILVAVLNTMLYKPVRRMLEEREARMSSVQGDVEKFERNATQLLENFNRKLAEARGQGQKERERFKQEAREQERQVLDASTKEAEARKQQLMKELTGEIGDARKDLLAQSEAFGVEIAQKLLGRAL